MRDLPRFLILVFITSIIAMCLFSGRSVASEIVRYEFEGTIDNVGYDSSFDPFRGTLQIGQSFRGTISIDTTVADHFPETPSRGLYEMGLLSIDGIKVKIGPHKFESQLPAAFADYHTVNMFNDFFGVDELSISSSDGFVTHRGPAVKDLAVGHMAIILTDPTRTMLSSDTLPFSAPEEFGFLSTNLFTIGGNIGPNNYGIDGHLTALNLITKPGKYSSEVDTSETSTPFAVPEPSAILLMFIGLIVFGFYKNSSLRIS